MTKRLEAINSDKCNGCELCAFESQRQSKKIGLEGAFIRIFKNLKDSKSRPTFSIEIDPRASSQDLEKIKNICPKHGFEIVEESE